jgi:hypothetical protein
LTWFLDLVARISRVNQILKLDLTCSLFALGSLTRIGIRLRRDICFGSTLKRLAVVVLCLTTLLLGGITSQTGDSTTHGTSLD